MNAVTPAKVHKHSADNNVVKVVKYLVMASFVIPIGCLIYSLAAIGRLSLPWATGRLQGDYMLMMLQCTLGIIILHLPYFLERYLHVDVPTFMKIIFTLYLFCAIYLGEVLNFYHRVNHWDSFLHLNSGVMIGFFGCMAFDFLNRRLNKCQNLSPAFVAIFVFCFSVCAGAIWEIYEYAIDRLMGLNMQKYLLANGEALSGQLALIDTMKDIILDTLGAAIASVACYISIKHKKGWISEYMARERAQYPEHTGSIVA